MLCICFLMSQCKQKVQAHGIDHSTHQKLLLPLYCRLHLMHFLGPMSNRTGDSDKAFKMHCSVAHDWTTLCTNFIGTDIDLQKFRILKMLRLKMQRMTYLEE